MWGHRVDWSTYEHGGSGVFGDGPPSPTTDSGVDLTLVLMDTYIALMILIGHLMRLSLTKLENIVLITITIPRPVSPLSLSFLVRPGGYTVNLCVFYFYKVIGKLTPSLELQEYI